MTAKRWLAWAAAAALAAPLAIILHELGHFLVGMAFGFPEVVLHYGSVSDGAAEAGLPLWKQGLQSAAGPAVTLLIVLGCCVATWRLGLKPWAVAPAFAAGLRSIAIGVAYLIARLRFPESRGNFDELNAANQLGVAPEPVIALNVLLMLGAWIFLVARVPSGLRFKVFSAIAAGTVGGLALYAGWLGPLLLP